MIDAVAARQHGVVSRAQLIAAGIPAHVVDYRVEQQRLRALHRGIYQLGPTRARWAREMAALLACGDGAVLSGRTAALLWDLTGRGATRRDVEVRVPRGRNVRRRGIRAQRRKALPSDELAIRHRLRVTTPARTLLDLAVILPEGPLERLVARADRRTLADHSDLLKLLDRYPGMPGSPKLRAILGQEGGPSFTRSEAEAKLLALIRKAKLPTPKANVRIAGIEVDFLWPDQRLVVEVDGLAYHGSTSAFEWDRKRDAVLATRGIRCVRLTWRQLVEEPEAVLVRVFAALAAGGP